MRIKATLSAYSFVMLVCCTIFSSSVNAQQKKELEYKHGGFGLCNNKYFLDDVKISKSKVAELLERENKEAYQVFKSARATTTAGYLALLPAEVLLTVGLGSYVLDGWNNVTKKPGLLIAGVVGTTGAVVLLIIGNSKFKKAANIYNNANSSTGKMHLNFGPTQSGGAGLIVSL